MASAPDASPDYRRACRPFAENCGFTIAESAQVLVLFDDALALELGAAVRASVVDVFVNADGHKKSISGPGVGNYATVARALAAARAVLGEKAFRHGGLVQAHGTGTPQNRTTESQILSRCAGAFGLEDLPVTALKCYPRPLHRRGLGRPGRADPGQLAAGHGAGHCHHRRHRRRCHR